MIEHRALAGGTQLLRRVRLGLLAPVPDLAAVLADDASARVLENAGSQALLEVRGDAVAQAALLRGLVERGLPVASFAEERENLHASYLRTVGNPGVAQ
jgi:hypothetical protein